METKIICPALGVLKNSAVESQFNASSEVCSEVCSGGWAVEDLLLPHLNINGALLDWLNQDNLSINPDHFIGVFAADPFAPWMEIVEKLHAHGVTKICNFPAISFHDLEFQKWLSEGGIGVAREQKRLAWINQFDFDFAWCGGHENAWKIEECSPVLTINTNSLNHSVELELERIYFDKAMVLDG